MELETIQCITSSEDSWSFFIGTNQGYYIAKYTKEGELKCSVWKRKTNFTLENDSIRKAAILGNSNIVAAIIADATGHDR